LLAAAPVFAAATVVYVWQWLAAVQLDRPAPVELGINCPYQPAQRAFVVTSVMPGSPAERAGLRAGDAMVAFDGRHVETAQDQDKAWNQHQPGDSVRLTVVRPGQDAPLELTGVFRRSSEALARDTLGGAVNRLAQNSFPLAFAAVGLVILFWRPGDRNVWLLACFFAGIIAAPSFPNNYQTAPAPLRPWLEAYNGFFLGMAGASFYYLCAVFPARSPVDRRLPWLKWVAVVLGLAVAADANLPDIALAGVAWPTATFSRVMNLQAASRVDFGIVLGFLAMGLVSLASSYFFSGSAESRRKIRVIFWGTVAGLGLPIIRAALQQYAGFQSPDWLETILNAVLLLIPASFAYAVFKQRVLDIPVLLQRGARYVLVQRGFLILLCFLSFGLTLGFAASLARLAPPAIGGQSASTAMGAVFGTALLWGGSQVHRRVSGKIDRAFFRGAYDARVVLENLAETSRTAPDRQALAQLLLNQLEAALQPVSLVVYLAAGNGDLEAVAGAAPPELRTIPSGAPVLAVSMAGWRRCIPAAWSRSWDATAGWLERWRLARACPASRTRARTSACWLRSPARRAWRSRISVWPRTLRKSSKTSAARRVRWRSRRRCKAVCCRRPRPFSRRSNAPGGASRRAASAETITTSWNWAGTRWDWCWRISPAKACTPLC
jgi:hypothetical protein